MTERPPDPGFEERVVRSLIASGDIRPRQRWRWMVPVGAAAAAMLTLLLVHPWTPPQIGGEYLFLLHNTPEYQWPPPGHLSDRRAEYGRWADSLDRRGQLRIGGRLEGVGDINGLFIIRAKDQVQADSIAAASPHSRYGGRVEVRPFIE
jgi:hypothetical protein